MKWADTQGDTHRDTQEIHGDERSSGADSPALAALIDQLAKKDEQIAKLMETVADSTKAAPVPQPSSPFLEKKGGRAASPKTNRG